MSKRLRVVKIYVLCIKQKGSWNPVINGDRQCISSTDEEVMKPILRDHMVKHPKETFKLRVSQLLIQESQNLEDMIARDLAKEEANAG
jgi:hypothetical protein